MTANPLDDDSWEARYRRDRAQNDKLAETTANQTLDRFILEQPDEAERLLKGYHLLLGNGAGQREDLRIGALPQTTHVDQRRFSMGLDHLTDLAGPMTPGEFMVVGAITGQGKTSYAERLALANAREQRVLFASLEMSPEQIRDRCVSKLMRASRDSVFAARDAQHPDYLAAIDKLQSLDLLVWGPKRSERTIQAITRRAEDVTADLLIIDYTRKLTGWEPGWKATTIVDDLWEWIKKTQIPTVLLTQVKRPSGPLANRRPTIHDFQDTSALEATATRTVILWRPFAGKPRFDNLAEIIIGKNRFGTMFTTHAHWVGATTDLWDMTEEESDNAPCCRKRRPVKPAPKPSRLSADDAEELFL